MKSKIKDISVMLGMLIKRSLNIFLKDKMSVFFSLLAPLIVLAVYVLFLADIQVDAVKSNFENVPIDDKLIKNFVDSWMLAGVISVACITVSFSAQNIMIADKERGVLVDILSSPIPRGLIGVAYLISNIIISLCLCYIVLARRISVACAYFSFRRFRRHTVNVDLLRRQNIRATRRFRRYNERGNRFPYRCLYAAFDVPESRSVYYVVCSGDIFGGVIQKFIHGRSIRENRRLP